MKNYYTKYFILLIFSLFALGNIQLYAIDTTPISQIIKETKVTISVKDVALDEIMKIINRQTKIDYGYQSDQNIDKNKKFSLDVTNILLDKALDILFANSEYSYKLSNNKIIIILSPKAEAKLQRVLKKIKIAGRVINIDTKEPIIGATVIIDGTNTGSITDKDGRFSFSASKNDNLTVQFIGMKDAVYKVINDVSNLTISMDIDVQQIKSVVVTGYQTIDRNLLSSSVSTISGADALQGNAHTLDNMLQGKIAGLQVLGSTSTPGASTKIRIRGTSTISGSREPLWVVDGIILEEPVSIPASELNSLDNVNLIGNAIGGLNPMDIESINVLKDASATAIYGVRAANGVIVVTTKKGVKGKPRVNYYGTVSVTERPSYNKLHRMNSFERVDVSKEIESRGLPYSFAPASLGYEGLLYDLYDRKIDYNDFLGKVKTLEENNTDWFDVLYKTAISHKHNISISGASDVVNYYFSGSYLSDNANVKGTGVEQYNTTFKLGFNITKNLTANVQLRGNITNKDYLQTGIKPYDYAYNTSRAIPAYDENGDYSFYNNEDGFLNHPLKYNILNEIEHSGREVNDNSIHFNSNITWKVLEDLRLSGTFATHNTNTTDKNWFGEETYQAAKLRRVDYGDPFPDDDVWREEQVKLPYGGKLKNMNTRNFGYTARLQMDYSKKFNNHLITLVGGAEARSSEYSGLSTTQWGYLPNRGEKFVDIDPTTYPQYKKMVSDTPDVVTNRLTNVASLYGIAAYSYQSRYIINANIRADGSNKFGQDKDARFLPIWSLSGRWNIQNEKFLENRALWLNELSIRGSYGIQGNVSDDQTPNMTIKLGSLDQVSGEYMSVMSQLPNPYLKWEKTTSYNLALDFSILDNRITGTVEYYHKMSTDQIVSVKVVSTTGVKNIVINAGDMMNKGYEFVLNTIPIKTKDFEWHISLNAAKNTNKVTKGGMQSEYTYNQYISGNVIIKDMAINSFYSYKFKELDGNGLPTFNDIEEKDGMTRDEMYNNVFEYSGNRIADLEGGFGTTFRYKSFTLGMFFNYSIGSSIRLNELYSNLGQRLPNPSQNMSDDFVDRWRKPGDENHTVIPSLSTDRLSLREMDSNREIDIGSNYWQMYNQSNIRVADGSYLRLKTAYLRYAIPESILRKLKLKMANVRFEGNNLFLLASKELKGQDPEQISFSGFGNTTPPVSTFTIGIDITF